MHCDETGPYRYDDYYQFEGPTHDLQRHGNMGRYEGFETHNNAFGRNPQTDYLEDDDYEIPLDEQPYYKQSNHCVTDVRTKY